MGSVRAHTSNRFRPKRCWNTFAKRKKPASAAPDLLTDRIAELGSACEEGLLRIAADESHCVSLRATAINLLREIASERAAAICVPIVEKEEELREVAVDLLRELAVHKQMFSSIDWIPYPLQ